tara:strand:+ start:1446 stop:1910 length:465 start_codon:yes stop_codon:yes gene_type:complete
VKKYHYLDNAFWEENDKSKLKCIRVTELEGGRTKKTVLSISKTRPDGSPDPVYNEVVDMLGQEAIDAYTEKRHQEKSTAKAEHEIKKAQEMETRKLEDLFSAKIRAMEIPSVKETQNKTLRTKIRRATNVMEVNALVTLIIGESLGLFGDKNAK